jgi:hypothetical protein
LRGGVVKTEDSKWLLSTVVALVGLLAATLGTLWGFGLLQQSGTKTDNRLSAALALVGVMITASVSVIGLLVKRQSDRRLEVDRAESERRLETARIEERQRLRLDAAMKAGSLLNSTASGPPNAAAVASGLLALTQLDQPSLAVALLVDLWSEKSGAKGRTNPGGDSINSTCPDGQDTVSHETAILVLDAALRSNSAEAQLVAADLLCRNAWRLDACQSLHWPSAIDGTWIPSLGNKTKLLLVDALIRMTYTSEPNENALRSLAVRLYGISSGDPSDRVKGCIGQLIQAILPALRAFGYTDFMHGPETVTLKELELAASKAMPNPDGMLERVLTDRSDSLKEGRRNVILRS